MAQCVKCDKPSLINCEKCNYMKYCSDQCQINDIADHQWICCSSLSERLRRVYNLYEQSQTVPKSIYLSSNNHCLDIDDKCYNIHPFSGSSTDLSCVICTKKITNSGPKNAIKFVLNRKRIEINCYRCDNCNRENKQMCSVTFIDIPSICFEKKMLSFLMCLDNFMFIPYDIKQFICNLAFHFRCCTLKA